MKEFNSNFNDGTGELNIQYEGTAGTTEAPVTSDCNCGEDRTVQVTVVTDDGGASKTVTVNQEGVREQFIPADQTEGIRGSDGELFLGIKEKYADAMPECCVPFNGNIIYINQLESDPAKMISGDVNGDVIQWIKNNSHRVLAKKTGEGTITYIELDDTNSNKYAADGSEAKTDGTEGDVFVKLPTFYYRGNNDNPDGSSGDNVEIKFSKEPFKDSVEWDTNTLIGAYEAYVIYDGNYYTLKSRSGVVSRGNLLQSDFKTYASNRGKGYQLVDWQMHCILGSLFYAMYGNANSQTICGSGTFDYAKKCGESNSLGMEDTKAETNGNKMSINFWGLENWYGNKCEYLQEDNINTEINTYDPITKGIRSVKIPYYEGGYPKKILFGKYLDLIVSINDIQDGTDSTGYCDYQYWNNTNKERTITRSGGNSLTSGGISYINSKNAYNYKATNYGSRLAFRGICTKAESVEAFKALPVL